jgi:O-antigen ligase
MKLTFLLLGPLAAYMIYLSGFQWRAQGSLDELLYITNRQNIWNRTIDQVKKSHYLGWGFHADRLLLDAEHVHNSYLHAMIHGGILGTIFFLIAILSAWVLIIKNKLIKRIRYIRGPDQTLLAESVLLLGFMTERSFFESTAAFYGVDLLLLVPVITYLFLWISSERKEIADPVAA